MSMERNARRTRGGTLAVVAGVMAFAAIGVGCGSSDSGDSGTSGSTSGSTSAEAKGKLTDVAYLDTGFTTYTKQMLAAVQKAADKNGIKLDHFSADNDPQKQLQQCQDAIATGRYQGILLYAIDGVAGQACAKQAIAAGIAVVPTQTILGPVQDAEDIQVDGVKAQVILSLKEDVDQTVKLVDEACKDKPKPCNVVKMVGTPGYYFFAYKLKHEVPIYKERGYNVVATPVVGGFDNPDGLTNAVNDILAQGKKIDVIVGDDDSSLQGAVKMKQKGELPKDTLLIGDGGNAAALEAIKAGDQFATVRDLPQSIGRTALEQLVKVVDGQPIDQPSIKMGDLGEAIGITRENVDGVSPEW